MAYVTVPKDLTKVKSKVLFGLTKRQLACFTPAVLIGVPLFFLLKGSAGNSMAAFVMILVMLPFFMLAMYERNGQTLEVTLGHFIRTKFLLPKERPYQTNNFFAVLSRQRNLEKEVKAIVKSNKAKAHPQRKAGN
ncbi:MAG: PrgI family protein [Lachnospiraceae bacterium]